MAHILKNKNLEIHVDDPMDNYGFSRFDWTGKISKVSFQNIEFAGIERTDILNEFQYGQGFYNEFGIDGALDYQEVQKGEWFHKIGIGLLKKDDDSYNFHKKYDIRPAKFEVQSDGNDMIINCRSEESNGYAYNLTKRIELNDAGFTIKYTLRNQGIKDIVIDEYNHNFMAIGKDLIGSNYILRFPFELKQNAFNEAVNLEGKVEVTDREFRFNGTPNDQFFYANISGGKSVNASWELINTERNVGIRETGSFNTNKINLWGWKHVISPELFFKIDLKPGETAEWSRIYDIFRIK